jgi:hypothetical protein
MLFQRDLKFELPLLHLSRMTSLRSHVAIFPCDLLKESTILGDVGSPLPDLQALQFPKITGDIHISPVCLLVL